MALAPRRVHNHEIDTKACGIVSLKFSDNWEIRDLTGRDFGVDKIVERFCDGYATSELLMLQIKGTEDIIDETNPHFSLDTKTLIYAEMFSVPFLLIFCSVNQPYKCYYLWLQEYIRVRLNYENQKWRTQQTNTLYFPKQNILGEDGAEEHLTYIAGFPRYQSSWVGYYLSLNDLCYGLPGVIEWELMDKEGIDLIINPITQKLISATGKFGQIPRKFIPDFFEETISLGIQILNDSEIPDRDVFLMFLRNCKMIQSSVEIIATRFDASYLRTLYEVDKTADY